MLPDLEQPWNILVAGVGGTGVITVGALISMAAHLEGKAVSLLDFTALAQRAGRCSATCVSHVAARYCTQCGSSGGKPI
ncbi:hypothetical protein AAFM48_31130 [Burkholderia pseudomallei]